jgi:hypothetical protein
VVLGPERAERDGVQPGGVAAGHQRGRGERDVHGVSVRVIAGCYNISRS